jgi:cell division protein FtsZ
MVFITAGMGGGTGTGAAPIIAKAAKTAGALTVGVVTKPFTFEGKKRSAHAELGIKFLKNYVDSLVVVPNDKLLQISEKNTSMLQAFAMADEILKQGVDGIASLIGEAGIINLDFADVKTVMSDRGLAHMGVGKASGEKRVEEAIRIAVDSPLLETNITGARAVLLNIMGGYDMGMLEVNEAADYIAKEADEDAIIIFGASVKEEITEEISVTVIATGFEDIMGKRALKKDGEEEDTSQGDSPENEDGMSLNGNAEASDGEAPEQRREDSYNPSNDFPIPSFLNKEIKF